MASVSNLGFDIPGDFVYEPVEYYNMGSGSSGIFPDLIFLGVNHHTESITVPSFIRSMEKGRKYQIIFEHPHNREVTPERISYLHHLEPETVKKGWDDPVHFDYAEYVKRLARFIRVIENKEKDLCDDACEMIKPIYDDYVIKQTKYDFFKRKVFPSFPDFSTQCAETFTRSVRFINEVVFDELKHRVCSEEFPARQKFLCHSIEQEAASGLPTIWVGGLRHFCRKSGGKLPKKVHEASLQLFEETVKKTGKSAVVVKSTELKISRSY